MSKKKKWLIYARVSTAGQAEKYGLDAQINILTKYAEDRGWDYELLNEGGVSGETIVERPKMIELLNKIKTGDYEGCLIIEEERLSRSERLGEWDIIKEAFREGKAKIATPARMLDPEKIDDDFILDIGGVLSKREKRIILKRMLRGKAEKLKQGKSIGGTTVPFGYRSNKETHEIEINPEEKEIFDMTVDWALDGLGIYEISNELNKLGIPTRYGILGWKMKNKPVTNLWRPSTIYKMLRQEYYTGLKPITYHFKKYHNEDVDLYLPPLISPEKFWQLQNKIKGSETNFRKKNNTFFYMLKGLLKCGYCGRTMYGRVSPKKRKDGSTYVYKFYRCENKNPPPRGINCDLKNVNQALVEEAVWNQVISIIEDNEKLALILKDNEDQHDKSIKNVKPKLEQFRKMLADKEDEEDRLLTAYRRGIISLDELENEKKKLTGEKVELTRKVNRLESDLNNIAFEQGKNKALKDYIKTVKSKIRDFTTEELFEFYHVCIENIVVDYDRKKDQHSININFAIPLLSENSPGNGGGGSGVASFSGRGGGHQTSYQESQSRWHPGYHCQFA